MLGQILQPGLTIESFLIQQPDNIAFGCADLAVGVFTQMHLLEIHFQSIIKEQLADFRQANSYNTFEGFGCLYGTDGAGQRAKYLYPPAHARS